jgi:hypothetical protein
VNATFQPDPLRVTGFDVQRRMTERSFIRYLGLQFNTTLVTAARLQAIRATVQDANPSNDRIKLVRYELDGSGAGQVISLKDKISALDHALEVDFGQLGLGGTQQGASELFTAYWNRLVGGDGWYQLLMDLDDNGSLETARRFYRLAGDVDGNRIVDTSDVNKVTDALAQAYQAEFDVDGVDGINGRDRNIVVKSRNRFLNPNLGLDD